MFADALPQMSATEDLPDMDGADLIGLLFQDGNNGCTEPLFQDEDGLIESWLSEQEVRLQALQPAIQGITFMFNYNQWK